MPAVQYPFIDIAVHARVRERFARGEAIVMFSASLDRVLWANGAGARLFGNPAIYDFLEEGPNRSDVTFRQVEATGRQLVNDGDSRTLMIRIASGFQRLSVQACVERLQTPAGEAAILFSVPVRTKRFGTADCARQMLDGFDDPDTHMAVLGRDGAIIAASPRFAALGIGDQTAQALIAMVSQHPERLMKRPIPTARGYLPAAIGRLADDPGLHLLFVVEMVIGNLDPTDEFTRILPETPGRDDAVAADAGAIDAGAAPDKGDDPQVAQEPIDATGYDAALDAVADIVDLDETIETDDEPAALPEADASAAFARDGGDVRIAEEPSEETDAPILTPGEDNGGQQAAAGIGPVSETATVDAAVAEIVAADEDSPGPADDGAPVDTVEPSFIVDADAPADENQTADTVAADDTESGPASTGEAPTEAIPPATIVDMPAEAAADAPESSVSEPDGFVFNPLARATRFVWKIDAEGRFSEVSNEFAKAVGPHAASVNGVAFTDIAHLFNLDPDGTIGDLLNKRDTWSGKTIYWPIEGTILKVPVDLAALPTYTRTRDFDGFRGFGIVRLADAVPDPLELGLTLTPQGAEDGDDATADIGAPIAAMPVAEPGETRPQEPVTRADGMAAAPEEVHLPAGETGTRVTAEEAMPGYADTPDEADGNEDASPQATSPDEDPTDPAPSSEIADEPPALTLPWGERPALRIVETANRRHSDKVIRLEERRARGREGLSAVEQAAFREIARQLEPLIRTADDAAAATPEDETESAPVADAAAPALVAEDATVETAAAAPEDAMTGGGDALRPDAVPEPVGEDEQDPADATAATGDAAEDVGQDPAFDQAQATLDVLHALIPPRAQMSEGLTIGIIDQMPIALLVHAGDTLIHANPEFLRLTGYATLDELDEIGGLDALLQREDLEETAERPGGLTLVRADDTLVPVMARLQSIRWESGNALMLALMPVDGVHRSPEAVPDRAAEQGPGRLRQKLARLQDEVEELRSILETATDGVVILDRDGDIRSMNRSASALFNYDNNETSGKPFVMLFAHESQKSVVDYLGALSGHGVASVLNDGREIIGREASGGFIPLFMTMGRLTASDGYCAVIRDITQWKRTEEELRNAKRAAETANAHKSDFLARVSHEIRTPLNAIIGFSDMMATERFGAIGHPRYVEYANDIGRSGRHVLDIVNDLLDISKIEAGEMDLEFIAVGLNETISEAVSLVQPQANSQRVIIRTALSHAVPAVVADLRSVKQIALNILANAIRFTPSGGQIVVSTSYEPNGSVVLRIRDTGVGMTRTELEQAMKPFRQVTTGTRQRGEGTGLGLPLTKAMVDANRANFAINSAPNEGTLVEITFPSPRVLAN